MGFGLFIYIPPASQLNFFGMYKEYLNGPPGPDITQLVTHPLVSLKNLMLHLWTHRKHYQSAMDYTFDIVSIGYFCALINLIFITKKQLLWAIYGLSYFWLFESLIGQAMLKMNPRIYTVYLAPALCISITLTFHHYCRKFIKSDVKRVVAWCIGIVLILQQSRGMEIWDRQYNWSKIISDYYSKDIVALMYADLVLPENDYIVTPHDASYNKMRNFVAKHSYIHTVGDYLEVFDELHNGAVFQIQDLMNYKADKARINSLILSRNVYALNKESLSKVLGYDTHLYIYEPIVIKFDRDMFQKHFHQPRYINAMSLPQEITIYRISIPQS